MDGVLAFPSATIATQAIILVPVPDPLGATGGVTSASRGPGSHSCGPAARVTGTRSSIEGLSGTGVRTRTAATSPAGVTRLVASGACPSTRSAASSHGTCSKLGAIKTLRGEGGRRAFSGGSRSASSWTTRQGSPRTTGAGAATGAQRTAPSPGTFTGIAVVTVTAAEGATERTISEGAAATLVLKVRTTPSGQEPDAGAPRAGGISIRATGSLCGTTAPTPRY